MIRNSTAATPGRGLVGMRERVAAFDGELDAGPHPDGGWRLRAVLSARAADPARRDPAQGDR
ncbi:hypothetical protein [Streptomyces sp. NPDC007856]|uniref:hypothetical protein n=1 Tax=Streptomyces sp. NPDC007856 TaxID=3364781 RepID=UPI0036AF1CE5